MMLEKTDMVQNCREFRPREFIQTSNALRGLRYDSIPSGLSSLYRFRSREAQP